MIEPTLNDEISEILKARDPRVLNLLVQVAERERRDRFAAQRTTPEDYATWAWQICHDSSKSTKNARK